ncbi:MAG: hypothetical protein QXP58_02100 [Thermoprotei archaeon]
MRQTNKTFSEKNHVLAPKDKFRLFLKKFKTMLNTKPALSLLVGVGVDDLFIGRSVNIYLLAGAIIAGLLFIFIMGFIIYEMFKH